MRFLCLHGRGTSAEIFKFQTARVRSRLDKSFVFEFVDGPLPSPPAAGIDIFYKGPYFSFWSSSSIEDVRTTLKWLAEFLDKNGPFDGVVAFSQGAHVVANFLLYHQLEKPSQPMPFKLAIFICGFLTADVLENPGVHVLSEDKGLDFIAKPEPFPRASDGSEAVSENLSEPPTDVKAKIVGGSQGSGKEWADPTGRGPNGSLHSINRSSCLLIQIPTLHVYGSKDPIYQGSRRLEQICEPGSRKSYDHGGVHEIPLKPPVAKQIAELITEIVETVKGQETSS